MTEEPISSTGHMSVVMTTTPDDDVTQTTGTSAAASSTSRGFEFYFQCAVVFVGFIGTIANGLVLYALVVSKQHKKKSLIFNQNALDLFGSLWLFITYSLKLGNIHLSGLSGYLLCALIVSDNFVWIGLLGSRINLQSVTVERYLKVVHNKWSKKWLRNWMIYSAIAFSWIASVCVFASVVFTTTAVVDGACYPLQWKNYSDMLAFSGWYFVSVYVILLMIIVYCYGHILVVVRRQSRVMAAHNSSGSTTAQDKKIKTNVIKTLIIVSTLYALFNFPNELFFLALLVNASMSTSDFAYHSTMFLVFVFASMNPFIYGLKFDPVKRVLRDLLHCKRNSNQTV